MARAALAPRDAFARVLASAPGPAHAARGPARWTVELSGASEWGPDAPGAPLDALLVSIERAEPDELAIQAAAAVRRGGVVALVGPLEALGGRGALQRAFALVTRTPIRPLEDVCAALLAARVSQLQVLRLAGARGEAIVYGVRVA